MWRGTLASSSFPSRWSCWQLTRSRYAHRSQFFQGFFQGPEWADQLRQPKSTWMAHRRTFAISVSVLHFSMNFSPLRLRVVPRHSTICSSTWSFSTHIPIVGLQSCAQGKWQVNSSSQAAGPAFQDEQTLVPFMLLRNLFTTKHELLIAFSYRRLRVSLFIRVEPGHFFGDLALHDIADVRRRMVVICVGFCPGVGFCQAVCDLQLTPPWEVFVTTLSQTVCTFECYINCPQAPRGGA